MHFLVGEQECTQPIDGCKFFLFLSTAADVLLWRNKKISGGVLGVATAVWVLFELIEYHLLTLVCHCAILALAGLFVWSKALSFINKYAFY